MAKKDMPQTQVVSGLGVLKVFEFNTYSILQAGKLRPKNWEILIGSHKESGRAGARTRVTHSLSSSY